MGYLRLLPEMLEKRVDELDKRITEVAAIQKVGQRVS